MTQEDTLREFLLVLRRALLMLVCYIEKKYGLTKDSDSS